MLEREKERERVSVFEQKWRVLSRKKENRAGLSPGARNGVVSFKRNGVVSVKPNDRASASHGRHAV